MPTVAEIAGLALDAVGGAIPGAVHAATLSHFVNGNYDATFGEYDTTLSSATGRMVIETSKPVTDIFPDYVAGPGDELILLEGFTACKEGWTLKANGKEWVIRQTQDILAAGSLFYVIGREVKS